MIDQTEEELVDAALIVSGLTIKVQVLEEVIKILAYELYGSDSSNDEINDRTVYIM